jgi:hypothetical protein
MKSAIANAEMKAVRHMASEACTGSRSIQTCRWPCVTRVDKSFRGSSRLFPDDRENNGLNPQ